MQIIAELGSCFEPGRPETLVDAAKAAMKAGADCVKIQVYDAEELAYRRGCDPERLRPWSLDIHQFGALAKALKKAGIPFGASVFGPKSANFACGFLTDAAFLKTATQEYQYAILADRVSSYAHSAGIPLHVSMPPDACCVVGNYWSAQPITWFLCVPHYPAARQDYCGPLMGPMNDPRHKALRCMFDTLPGRFGISDHTVDASLLRQLKSWLGDEFSGKLVAFEKHFLYDEALRGEVPDGGPWALSRRDFALFAKEVRS